MLEGNVEIGQDLSFRHQRQDLIDMRVGIDVMQPHPGAEAAERFGEARNRVSRSSPRHALLA